MSRGGEGEYQGKELEIGEALNLKKNSPGGLSEFSPVCGLERYQMSTSEQAAVTGKKKKGSPADTQTIGQ